MFRTKFIAIFLCLTTVFAAFAGVTFAEDTTDEETIVIKDGKVVSGSSELVESGFIVIMDEDESETAEENTMTDEEKLQYLLDNKANFFKPIPTENGGQGTSAPSETPNAVNPSTPSQSTSTVPEGTAQPSVEDVSVPSIGSISLSTATPNYTGFLSTIGNSDTTVNPWLNAPSKVTGETVNSQRTLKYTHTRIKTKVFYNMYFRIPVASGQIFELIFDPDTSKAAAGSRGLQRAHPDYDSSSSLYTDASNNLGRYMFNVAGTMRVIGGLTNDPDYRFYFDGNGRSFSGGTFQGTSNNTVSAPIFYVNGGTLELKNVHIRDNISTFTNAAGSAIHITNGGVVRLENVVIENCKLTNTTVKSDGVTTQGGAIYINGSGTVSIKNCTIKNCSAGQGGAIATAENANGVNNVNNNYIIQIENTTIQDCSAVNAFSGATNTGYAPNGGGAIYLGSNLGKKVSIKNSTIKNCTASGNGGGIFLASGTTLETQGDYYTALTGGNAAKMVITGCTSKYAEIQGAGLPAGGGGLYAESGSTLRLKNTVFDNCCAENGDGGGLFTNGATVDMIGCRVDNCYIKDTSPMSDHNYNKYTIGSTTYFAVSALKTGSGMRALGGTANLVNTTFVYNQKGRTGTATNVSGLPMTVRGTLYISAGATVNMIEVARTTYNVGMDARLTSNEYGGGVYLYGNATFRMYGGSINRNTMLYRNPTYITTTDPDGNEGYSNGTGVMLHAGDGSIPRFEMYGGTLEDCQNQTKGKGGAIGTLAGGTVVIHGGIIGCGVDGSLLTDEDGNKNKATYGSAIYMDSKGTNNLYIAGGTIANGSQDQGAVYMGTNTYLEMTGGTISGNTANKEGGGIYAAAGTDLYISGGTIENNTASTNGGGVYAYALGHFIVGTKDSTDSDRPVFKNNTASNDGGGICAYRCGVWIYNAEVSGNTAVHGAGIYMTDSGDANELKLTIKDGDIINNVKGGGIWMSGDGLLTYLDMVGGNVSGNTLTPSGHNFGGAGICATQHVTVNITGTADSPVTINNNVNSANSGVGSTDAQKNYKYDTSMNGGGIACIVRNEEAKEYGGTLTIKGNVTISGNSVPSNCSNNYTSKNGMGCGGGVYMEEGGTVIIQADEAGNKPNISGNTAYRGGGVYIEGYTGYTTSLTVDGASFDGNVSNEYRYILDANGNTSNPNSLGGAGICVYRNVTTSIKNSSFTNNKASMQSGVGGGGISAVDLTAITVENCTFTDNYVAARNAAYASDSSVTGDGGAVFCRNIATVNVTGCTMTGNKAQQGGALYVIRDSYYNSDANRSTVINISGCTAEGNTDGAFFFQRNADNATYARAITVNVSSTTIDGNTTGNHGSHRFGGAGITCVNGITLNLNSGTVISNNANNVEYIATAPTGISNIEEVDTAAHGGGVAMIRKGTANYLSAGTLTVNGGVTIEGNTAKYGNGGGIYVEDSTAKLVIQSSDTESVVIKNNTAGHEGYVYAVDDNTTDLGSGGGVYAGEGSKISVTGKASYPVVIEDNKAIGGVSSFNAAGHGGGGIMLNSNLHTDGTDTVYIKYAEIKDNVVKEQKGDGGGINCVHVNLNISDSVISGNEALTANSNGAGIHCQNSPYTLTVTDCRFAENKANGFGGGVYSANPSTVTIDGCVFDGNISRRGGGICVYNNASSSSNKGTITVKDTDFGNNEAKILLETGGAQEGGAIAVMGYVLTLEGECNVGWLEKDGALTAAPNVAECNGGGIWLSKDSVSSQLIVADGAAVNVSNNRATGVRDTTVTGHGGGIFIDESAVIPDLKGWVINDNTAENNGGGIYISRTEYTTEAGKLLTLIGCSVNRNTATNGSGGGVYAVNTKLTVNNHGSTAYCTYEGNAAGIDGGAIKVVKTDATPVSDGTAMFRLSGTNFISNSAGVDGGAISVENAPGYVVNSYIYGNTAAGNGGGVHYIGNDVEEDSILQMALVAMGTNKDTNGVNIATDKRGNKADGFGGGLYVANCMDFVNVRGGFNYNEALRGGGVYVLDCQKALFTEDGSAFKYANAGVAASGTNSYVFFGANKTYRPENPSDSAIDGNGAGLYAESNVTLSNVIMQFNSARFDGGGICVGKTYTVTMNGVNDINNNVSYNYGGGIIVLSGGTLNIAGDAEGNNKTLIRGNRLITDYRGGAGVHVANGATFNMSYGEIIENGRQQDVSNPAILNNVGKGSGGGIDVTGGTAVLNNVIIADNAAGTNGGGVRLTGGSFTATNCVIKGNLATNGNGGGLFVTGVNSVVTVNGFIIDNEAKGAGSGTSMVSAGNVNGVGGGVAVFDGASFAHTGGAIYNNRAETGGADVFANGLSTTKLSILAPSAMDTNGASLLGVDIPAFERNGETVGKWWEDYMTGDTNYTNGLYGDRPPAFRYADSPVSIRAYTTSGEGTQSKGNYINTDGEFVSIIFDIQKYNVGTITITAPETDVENQRFVFEITGTTDKGERVNITVSLESGESVTIEDVYPGTYQITQKTDWSWRCEIDGVELDGGGKQDGVVTVTVDIEGVTVDDDHTVVYTGNDATNKWLSHNSVERVNIPPNTVIPESPRALSADMTEAKRGYVF